MITSIQQPHYFPWIGYFEQIASSDHFVFLDTVQWIKQGRQHRAKIKSPISQATPFLYLTVPINSQGHRSKQFREMRIDAHQNWQKHHWNSIKSIYGKSPYFRTQLEPIYNEFLLKSQSKKFLIDICLESLFAIWDHLCLSSELHFASDYEESKSTEKNLRLIHLCQKTSANTYYSTIGSARYMDLELFRQYGIKVQQQNLRHSSILERQIDISIIDWIANIEFLKITQLINYRKTLHINNQKIPSLDSLQK